MSFPLSPHTVSQTHNSEVVVSGMGVHLGRPCRVQLKRNGQNTLRIFTEYNLTPYIPGILPTPSLETNWSTGVKERTRKIDVWEHILAAFTPYSHFGIDVYLYGREFPIGDGSARLWQKAIHQLGINLDSHYYKLTPSRLNYSEKNAWGGSITCEPSDRFEVYCEAPFSAFSNACFVWPPSNFSKENKQDNIKANTMANTKANTKDNFHDENNGNGNDTQTDKKESYRTRYNEGREKVLRTVAGKEFHQLNLSDILSCRTFTTWTGWKRAFLKGKLRGVRPNCGFGIAQTKHEWLEAQTWLGSLDASRFPQFWGKRLANSWECAGHKILDFLGDLAWLGPNLPSLKIKLNQVGHTDHIKLLEVLKNE